MNLKTKKNKDVKKHLYEHQQKLLGCKVPIFLGSKKFFTE